MANDNEAVRQKWHTIKERGITVPSAVIEEFHKKCLDHIIAIEVIASSYCERDIPVEQLAVIVQHADRITLFLRTIKKSNGVCSFEQRVITLDEMTKDLLSHYIGNDLYCITLGCGAALDDKNPFSANRVLEHTVTMRAFFRRFQEEYKERRLK